MSKLSFFTLVFYLQIFLRKTFGFKPRPCNPYVGDYYVDPTEGKVVFGNNLPIGNYQKLEIPDFPNELSMVIKGRTHMISYNSGIMTLFYNDKLYKSEADKSDYNKLAFIIDILCENTRNGLFKSIGVYKGKAVFHFIDVLSLFKSKRILKSDFYKITDCFYKECIIGTEFSFLTLLISISILVFSVLSLENTISVKNEAKRTSLKNLMVSTCVISVLIYFLNKVDSLIVKVLIYKFYITYLLNYFDYKSSILTDKYCVECFGHPLKCSKDEIYTVFKSLNECKNEEYTEEQYRLVESTYRKVCLEKISRIFHQKFKLKIYSGTKKVVYNPLMNNSFTHESPLNDLIVTQWGNCELTLKRIRQHIFLTVRSNSLFNTQIKSFCKVLSPESYSALLSFLRVLKLSSKDKSFIKERIYSGCGTKFGFISNNERNEISEFIDKLNGETMFNIEFEKNWGKYSHCDKLSDLMKFISKNNCEVIFKTFENSSWCLGVLNLNNIKINDYNILKTHNKKFFGGEGCPEALEISFKIFKPMTPEGICCSKWKKYQVDLKYLLTKMGYFFNKPVDSKRYKPNSWLDEFLDKIKREEIQINFEKSKIINEFIIKEGESFYDEIKERGLINEPVNLPEEMNFRTESFIILKNHLYDFPNIIRNQRKIYFEKLNKSSVLENLRSMEIKRLSEPLKKISDKKKRKMDRNQLQNVVDQPSVDLELIQLEINKMNEEGNLIEESVNKQAKAAKNVDSVVCGMIYNPSNKTGFETKTKILRCKKWLNDSAKNLKMGVYMDPQLRKKVIELMELKRKMDSNYINKGYLLGSAHFNLSKIGSVVAEVEGIMEEYEKYICDDLKKWCTTIIEILFSFKEELNSLIEEIGDLERDYLSFQESAITFIKENYKNVGLSNQLFKKIQDNYSVIFSGIGSKQKRRIRDKQKTVRNNFYKKQDLEGKLSQLFTNKEGKFTKMSKKTAKMKIRLTHFKNPIRAVLDEEIISVVLLALIIFNNFKQSRKIYGFDEKLNFDVRTRKGLIYSIIN